MKNIREPVCWRESDETIGSWFYTVYGKKTMVVGDEYCTIHCGEYALSIMLLKRDMNKFEFDYEEDNSGYFTTYKRKIR